jgi:hypothetical protein
MTKNDTSETGEIKLKSLHRTTKAHISLIVAPKGYNRRIIRNNKEALKAQILAVGKVTKPILVFSVNGKYEIHEGFGRHECLLELIAEGQNVEPYMIVDIIDKPKTEEDKKLRLAEQFILNEGESFKPLEIAGIIRDLQSGEKPWTDNQVANHFGRTPSWVGQTLRLLELSEPARELVLHDKVSGSPASDMIRDYGPEKASSLIIEMVEVAKAEGKEKATPKHLAKILENKPEIVAKKPRKTQSANREKGAKKAEEQKPSETKQPTQEIKQDTTPDNTTDNKFSDKLHDIAKLAKDIFESSSAKGIVRDSTDGKRYLNVEIDQEKYEAICKLLGV